jgi:hypothetical protein
MALTEKVTVCVAVCAWAMLETKASAKAAAANKRTVFMGVRLEERGLRELRGWSGAIAAHQEISKLGT